MYSYNSLIKSVSDWDDPMIIFKWQEEEKRREGRGKKRRRGEEKKNQWQQVIAYYILILYIDIDNTYVYICCD